MLSIFLQNLRYATRQLLNRPGFTLFAVLSLAIGIAASTTLFSVVNTFLFAPVSGIGTQTTVVELGRTRHGDGFESFSYPDFSDYALRAKNFATLFAYAMQPLNVSVAGEPQRALGLVVSGNYFDTLQVAAYRGRLLSDNDDRDGAAPVVVASYAAWRKYLDGDTTAVGKPVLINGQAFTLAGIAAPEFHGTIALLTPAFYVPLHQLALLKPGAPRRFDERASAWLSLAARLTPDTTVALAQNQLSVIGQQLASAYPRPRNDGGISVVALRAVPGEFRGGLIAFSGLLFALISLILLVACVNVASMLLARGEARRHEIAMRFVLGASRTRVISQLLTESILLSLGAGVIGVLLGRGCCALLSQIDPPTPVPISMHVPMDGAALMFALGCTLVTALVFGLLPALRISKHAPGASQALVSRQIAGGRSRLGSTLVVAQIALTMVLLVSGGLFMRALQRAAAIDTGFDPQHVLTADFNLEPSGYAPAALAQIQKTFTEHVRQMPGVEQAALAALVPLDLSHMSFGSFQLPNLPEDAVSPDTNLVSPGFFETLDIKLQGRGFDLHDNKGNTEVCVVNVALAHLLVPSGDVLGRSFVYGDKDDLHTLTVIGIAANGKYASLSETSEPFLFLPLTQWPRAEASLVVKTSLPPNTFAMQMRSELHTLDASVPAGQIHPLTDVIALSLLPQRIVGMISLALGGIGLLLAAIGLYGLIAMHVASRTREFGVRLAMGASPRRIVADVLRRGALLASSGLVIGAVLSLGGAMLVSSLLFGANAADALAFLGAGLLLAAIAMLASYLPARRAASINPIIALRQE
ncbi:ABC transporter permease [Pseudolysobacter antarcticus]|uniref:ABC transporter permease n=1 Tax=Pseudolysobacter antarcticus TaxID=2511995 RepID=A0A411HF50_9GAMM|nr:ABC transporter permease [Pseudolysobacter antarcticus]QBB69110.1 ABC transporter permease [Pseudolysobacter antarcticus]